RSSVSKPSSSGIERSRTMRSVGSAWNVRRAARPSIAVTTPYPAPRRSSSSRRRMSSSSSTTSTRRKGAVTTALSMRNAPADEMAVKRLNPAAVAMAALAAVLLTGSSAQALRLPAARHCPVFPADNPWNQREDKLPVSADSAQLISSIGLNAPVHADFGSGIWDGGPIGIPFDVVSRKTARRRVSFQYASESNRVRYPIPQHVHIEGGARSTGDRHAILVDKSSCRLYELYDLRQA